MKKTRMCRGFFISKQVTLLHNIKSIIVWLQIFLDGRYPAVIDVLCFENQ